MLNRRLQVLVDDERYELLASESARIGAPIGELVRRAIDHEFALPASNRAAAARQLLAMPPPPGEGMEPDWEEQKREMRDRSHKWPGA
jgi:hypothetical protein